MNGSEPIVTVIIATYNKAAALRCAVESVLWQTFEDFELWVIGDGCTDNSAQVVEGYDDPRVNWYNLPENSGYQSAPHNEGLRRARGKYIAYLNHDDVWFPNHLQVLVDCLEETGADFAYTIMEWVLRNREWYADIPTFPNAPRPPEASVTMHRREIVDEIGFWKPPQETFAVPRAEYFRRAQFIGKRFEMVPMLTLLKFGGARGGYSAVGEQPVLMEKIRNDPDFAHKELGALLARAYYKIERPTSPRHYQKQVSESFRRWLIKRRIDPARLVFWHKPGRHIKGWRREHKID